MYPIQRSEFVPASYVLHQQTWQKIDPAVISRLRNPNPYYDVGEMSWFQEIKRALIISIHQSLMICSYDFTK